MNCKNIDFFSDTYQKFYFFLFINLFKNLFLKIEYKDITLTF
jgi:hypothetical protein